MSGKAERGQNAVGLSEASRFPLLIPSKTRPATTKQVAMALLTSCHPRNFSSSQAGRSFVSSSAPRKMTAYRTPAIASTMAGCARLMA